MSKQFSKSAERICALLKIYAPLLTEKQQLYTRKHYEEGIPFSKIAAQAKVSRQSIFDTVNQALAALEHYEQKLQLSSRLGMLSASPQFAGTAESDINPKAVTEDYEQKINYIQQALINIRNKIQQQRVIYNTDWLLRELSALIALLNNGGK